MIKNISILSGILAGFMVLISCIPVVAYTQLFMYSVLIIVSGIGIMKIKFNYDVLRVGNKQSGTCKTELTVVPNDSFLEQIKKELAIPNTQETQGNDHDTDTMTPGILSAVADCDCLLIWGGRGAGKTEFMRHYSAMKIEQGHMVVIIDPKPYVHDKWDNRIKLIGYNEDYKKIEQIREHYKKDIAIRKNDFSNIKNYPVMTIIVDELFVLNIEIPGFMEKLLPVLLMGREYGINLCVISQSKTASSLGLKGHYDLLQCFDALVNLKRNGDKNLNSSYSAIMENSDGKKTYSLPGEYIPNNKSCHTSTHNTAYKNATASTVRSYDNHARPEYMTISHDPNIPEIQPEKTIRFYESKIEKTICDMYENGFTINAIALKIYGANNGRRTKYIKSVLKNHNVKR